MSNLEAFCKNPGPASKGGLNMSDIVTELKKRGLDSKGDRSKLVKRLCSAVKKQSKVVSGSPTPKKKQRASPAPSPKTPESPVKPMKTLKKQAKLVLPVKPMKQTTTPKNTYIQATDDQFTAVTRYDPKRRIIYLSGPILRAMSDFVKAGTEYGGMIDINSDGSFDRSIFGIGKQAAINLEDMMDFEVIFHTHPAGRTAFMFEQPSGSDINLSMVAGHNAKRTTRDATHQVHVVFTPEGIYTIYALTSSSEEVRKQAIEAYNKTGSHDDIKNVIKRIESVGKYGVYVFRYSKITELEDVDDEPINNWPESIPLYIDPQEPVIRLLERKVRHETSQQRQERLIKQADDRATYRILRQQRKERLLKQALEEGDI